MITCVIVDDEQHAVNILTAYIVDLPDVKLLWSTTNILENIERLRNDSPDLIFLDINMPKITGLDLIQILKSPASNPQIIFTTAYSEYAVKGFEYEAIDYLLKPISFERFVKAIQKVQNLLGAKPDKQSGKKSYIFVKVDTKNKTVKINFSDILYVEGLKNYVSFFTSKERIVTLLNLKDLEQTFPEEQFVRVHRSYIVAIDRIKSIDGNRIYLENSSNYIPLGETYKEKFFEFMQKNSLR